MEKGFVVLVKNPSQSPIHGSRSGGNTIYLAKKATYWFRKEIARYDLDMEGSALCDNCRSRAVIVFLRFLISRVSTF
jgi:hypothetical protein